MKYKLLLPFCLFLFSCNWVKQKAKDGVNKSGEIVGKTGSEFAEGVKKGVEKTFSNEVVFSEDLTKSGLKAGKLTISSADSGTDNKLTVYFIFDQDFDRPVTAKVFDENGTEYGRVTETLKAKKGEAHYVDMLFDKRTNIDSKGRISFE